MPVQGSLRDLSVLETLQLIGAQRKSAELLIESDEDEAHFHFRDGLLVAAHRKDPRSNETFIELLVGLGHIAPADSIHIIEEAREHRRDIWMLMSEVPHLSRETRETVYLRSVEAQLDKVLLWERGRFSILPPCGIEEALRPGISMDVLLVDAMRRLDELAAWKQGLLPPATVPCLRGPDEWLVGNDPLRRAVVRQIDGRRTIAEVVEETHLGEHDVYETIAAGCEAGWIQFLPMGLGSEARANEPREGRAALKPVLRRSPALIAVGILLTIGLGSSWTGRRVTVDRTAWDQARTKWEEIDLQRAIEIWRYRHGAYPAALDSLTKDRIPLTAGFEDRWDYRIEQDSYRLSRRDESSPRPPSSDPPASAKPSLKVPRGKGSPARVPPKMAATPAGKSQATKRTFPHP
jgi:hypothetical protein